MLKGLSIDELKQHFSGKDMITRKALFDFYTSFEPGLKESTFAWRIYALKEKNLLKPVKRGIYSFSGKAEFHPTLYPRLKDISNKIHHRFSAARYSIWSTRWLNEWMIHQPGRFLIVVEVEAATAESVFYFLKDQNFKNVYYNPDDEVWKRYVSEQWESILVRPLITKAPIQKEKKIPVPSLEKILVDLFTDKMAFAAYQGNELVQIYNHVYKNYTLNITRLLAYARRRAKDEEITDFIARNTHLAQLLNE